MAKSKSTAMNLSSHVPTSSSSAKSLISSKSPGIITATGKRESRMRRNSRSDAASSSQARLEDAYLGGLMDTATEKPVATKEESGDVDLSESETESEEDVTEKPVAYKTASEKPYASSKSDCQGGPKAEKIEWSHNLHVSPATIHHTEAVFSIVREIYGRKHDDLMNDLDVNMAIWCTFLNATLRAAVHLGQDHQANLRYVKNNLRNSVGQLFNETGKLISEQKEITGVSTIDFKDAMDVEKLFVQPSLSNHPRQSLCLLRLCALCGKMGDDPIATWKSKIKCYSENNHFKDVNRIDGMPTEFEWKIFPGITTLGLLEKIQSLMRDLQCEPEHFKDRIIFMSMYNDIAWGEKRKQRKMRLQFTDSCELCSQIPSRSLVFLGAWIRRKAVRNLH